MVRSLRAAAVLLAAVVSRTDAVSAPASSQGYWLEPAPAQIWEAALHRAATAGDPRRTVEELREIAKRDPGSLASGLAHLGAGLILAEQGSFAEAVPHLAHPAILPTRLELHALRALAVAYEKTGQYQKAAEAYHRLADQADPNPLHCPVLLRAAEVDVLVGRTGDAAALLQRALAECPGTEAQALLQLGQVQEKRGDPRAAVSAYERVDRDHPQTPSGKDAAARLKALSRHRPAMTREERIGHDLKKALVLFEAGEHRSAIQLFQTLLTLRPDADDLALVQVRLGRAYMATGQNGPARATLSKVGKDSAVASEAAYHLARIEARRRGQPAPYEAVASGFPGTIWGEEALLDLAHHYQRDGKDALALPYFRRLYEGYPKGKYADAAAFRVGFGEWRAGRHVQAAEVFENAARERPGSSWRPAYVYWAGRSRRALGQEEKARAHFEDVYVRHKNLYHGIKAREALGQVAAGASTTAPAPPPGVADIPEPMRTRVRHLLLLDRLREAMEELSAATPTPQVQATRAWIFNRLGQLRPGITAMKRAYPEHATAAGGLLPESVWRILYPLPFEEELRAAAATAGVDPALVAGVIMQESTFDPRAVSVAGARGLMQIMMPTGRSLGREVGIRQLRPQDLFDPHTALRLGTRYLREVIGRFGGRVERALAAYNAGPYRVAVWNANRSGMSPEEFVDSIPYSETRTYVMIVLTSQEQYRRIYGLPAAGVGSAGRGR